MAKRTRGPGKGKSGMAQYVSVGPSVRRAEELLERVLQGELSTAKDHFLLDYASLNLRYRLLALRKKRFDLDKMDEDFAKAEKDGKTLGFEIGKMLAVSQVVLFLASDVERAEDMQKRIAEARENANLDPSPTLLI